MKEKLVTVKVDHPLGSADEDNPSSVYPINAGYVLNESDLELSKHDEKQRAYLVGVDVAVDEYAGILIAVARRRDDSDTVWIVAPENILYNKQQLEEIVHFKEQYYDGFIEMVDEEMWDAYDAQENKLGYEVRRSMAKSMPDGVYHVVVMIYTVTKDGKVLITQRSRNKTNPLKWEVTGGSIIAGESSNEGASRELYEETGLLCKPEELITLYEYTDHNKHCIYHGYINLCDKEERITLQPGETMDYMYVPYDEFFEFVMSDRFI
uniref:NUDIX hydrolase n=1 Tax=Lachnospira sp. TaxID=2049031 RepID=UPI0040275B2D